MAGQTHDHAYYKKFGIKAGWRSSFASKSWDIEFSSKKGKLKLTVRGDKIFVEGTSKTGFFSKTTEYKKEFSNLEEAERVLIEKLKTKG